MERALGELLQTFLVMTRVDNAQADFRRRAQQLAQRWPLLARCFELDPPTILRQPTDVVRFDGIATARTIEPVAQQVRHVVERLEACGFQVGKRRWTPESSRVPVVCALVPGLEMFCAIWNGLAVLPTGRGWSHIEARLAASASPDGGARPRHHP